jgi:serine/threonine protein phosphatase 1
MLIAAQRRPSSQFVCLRGNHEALMLAAADTGDHRHWLANGGGHTLTSYGVHRASDIPTEHLKWVASLPLFYDDALRFFTHAGVNPNRPLDDQCEEDLLWIREPFLSCECNYGRLIVHGHTPVLERKPDLRNWRLNLFRPSSRRSKLGITIYSPSDLPNSGGD